MREIVKLMGSHEVADTRLILHSCDAVNEGYQRIVVICRDTGVMLLLVHFLFRIAKEVWMISGTATSRKCFPKHIAADRLTQPVRENLLSFHALTGCDTTSAFRGFGKKSCWNKFIKQTLFLQGVGRVGDLDPIETLCQLYGLPYKSTVNDARMRLFTPTRDAIDLHSLSQLLGKDLVTCRSERFCRCISSRHCRLKEK